MIDEAELHEALVELFAVANAAMTRSQRVQRAAPVLKGAGLAIPDVVKAVRQPDLPWNIERANALGVGPDVWQQALDTAGLDAVTDLGELLDVMHRAEAAAAMIRAGYTPERDEGGRLSWAR
jgi:hypothetical protein